MSKISLKHSGGNVVSLNSPTNAPGAADVAFKLPNADGSAGQFMKTDGSGNLAFAAAGGGITQADQFRLTTNLDTNSSFITANLERNDTNFSQVGNGVTESSGVFTFPETGIYHISALTTGQGVSSTASYIGLEIHETTDNSSFSNAGHGYAGITSTAQFFNLKAEVIFDVTNVSTHKVKFKAVGESTVRFKGNSSINETSFTFIRLGDT